MKSRTQLLEELARRQAELTTEIERLRRSISGVLAEIEYLQSERERVRLRMAWLRQPPPRPELTAPARVVERRRGRSVASSNRSDFDRLVEQLAAKLEL